MKFLKERSYDIVRLFVNQLGIAIFSMALYCAVAMALPEDFPQAPTIRLVISVASTLFYFYLIYMSVWELGSKDRIRIDSGKMKRKPLTGILLAVFANLPNFLIIGISLIFWGAYSASGDEYLWLVFATIHSITVFIESMYTGIVTAIVPVAAENAAVADIAIPFLLRSLLYVAMPFLASIVSHLAYALGERNFKLRSIFSANRKK